MKKKTDGRKLAGKKRREFNMKLENVLNRYFAYYGIEASTWKANISEIELRRIMIKLAKTCYGLGLQESRILNNTFLELTEESKQPQWVKNKRMCDIA